MPDTRTAGVLFLVVIPQDALPHEEGPLDVPFDRIPELLPATADELRGLHDGGWGFTGAYAQEGGLLDEDGSPVIETAVSFRKEFESATKADVIADARRCGVTEDYDPQFWWEDGERDLDYDTYWYLYSSV